MHISDTNAQRQWDKPRDDERRNPPAGYRRVGQDADSDNRQRDETYERLIEDALQQDEREVAIHRRAEDSHGGGRWNESADGGCERGGAKFDDPGPGYGCRSNRPRGVGVMCLQEYRQHDRERIRNDGRYVIAVD